MITKDTRIRNLTIEEFQGLLGDQQCFGDRYFVDGTYGSNTFSGRTPGTAVKTLAKAYEKCTSNQNDWIIIQGYAATVETAMIDWSKSRIHVFADNGPAPRLGYGCGARVTMGVTTDSGDIAIIKNTGVRNTFNGIKFDNQNTLTEAFYTFAEGGEYTRFNNCEFYNGTHLTIAEAAEVLCNGDSSQWYGCTFGDLVNEVGTGGSRPRPGVIFIRETITGKVARDCSFYECTFLRKAQNTGVCMMYIKGATDIERRLLLVRPIFINAHLATADPADAILIAAAQTQGKILIVDPSTFDCSAHATASAGAYLTGGSAPVDSTTGLGAIIDT